MFIHLGDTIQASKTPKNEAGESEGTSGTASVGAVAHTSVLDACFSFIDDYEPATPPAAASKAQSGGAGSAPDITDAIRNLNFTPGTNL